MKLFDSIIGLFNENVIRNLLLRNFPSSFFSTLPCSFSSPPPTSSNPPSLDTSVPSTSSSLATSSPPFSQKEGEEDNLATLEKAKKKKENRVNSYLSLFPGEWTKKRRTALFDSYLLYAQNQLKLANELFDSWVPFLIPPLPPSSSPISLPPSLSPSSPLNNDPLSKKENSNNNNHSFVSLEVKSKEEKKEDYSIKSEEIEEEQREGEEALYDEETEEAFYGQFLKVVLMKVESMLENKLEANLLITSIISKLALHPNPFLTLFLFNNENPSCPSVFHSLCKVSEKGSKLAQRIPEFEKKIDKYRQSLSSLDSNNVDSNSVTTPSDSLSNSTSLQPFLSSSDSFHKEFEAKFMRSVVVLDEFQVEVASILQAKMALNLINSL